MATYSQYQKTKQISKQAEGITVLITMKTTQILFITFQMKLQKLIVPVFKKNFNDLKKKTQQSFLGLLPPGIYSNFITYIFNIYIFNRGGKK